MSEDLDKKRFKIIREFYPLLNDSNLNLRQAKYEGSLSLAGIETTCYVTDDGMRVLSSRRLQDILKVAEESNIQTSGGRWSRFLNFQWVQSLFDNDFNRALIEPIELTTGGKNRIVAYRAELIPELCEVILRARRENKLSTDRQLIIAQQCEILLSSLAKVGIAALIDEATGYQLNRKHDALRYLLERYINEAISSWVKMFPDSFFTELDRLYGNEATTSKNRPQYYGKFINTFIYDPIENGYVKSELNKLNIEDDGKRTARFHQWLSDIGRNQLTLQIGRVLGVMEHCNSIDQFRAKIQRQKALSIQPELFDTHE
ncbi:MAG: P63C domain-containing protein [Brevinema sp.]